MNNVTWHFKFFILSFVPRRILATFQADGNLIDLNKPTGETFTIAYEALVQEKPLTCAVKGATFDAVLGPTTVIADVSWTGNPLI